MTSDDPGTARALVTLRCSITVAGRVLTAIQEFPRTAWEDTALRGHLEQVTRSALEQVVMRETGALPDLAAISRAPVTTHVPTEREDELFRDALSRHK